MAELLHLTARLPALTGIPADTTEVSVNIYSPTGSFSTGDLASYAAALTDFFDTLPSGATLKVGEYIAESVSRTTNACTVIGYTTTDLTGATPLGSPVVTTSFTMPAPVVGSSLPQEVSAVISYNGNLTDVPITEPNPTPPPATIRPAQRRRGRMFLGPLQNNAGEASSNFYRPSSEFRTDATLAFKKLCNAVAAITDDDVVVWSKADAAAYPVVGGYMDDAWDTQRRRGLDATTRTTFVV